MYGEGDRKLSQILDKLMMCKYIISKYEITGQLDIYNSIEYVEKEYGELKLKCEQSLKLQELVKDMLEKRMGKEHPDHQGYNLCMNSFQSLIEESEK